MSQETFSDLLTRLDAFERIFVFCPKVDFLQGVSPRSWVKNEHIFKSTFFTPLCP